MYCATKKILFLALLFLACSKLCAQQTYFEKANRTFNIDSSIFYAEKHLEWVTQKRDTAQIVEIVCLLSKNYTLKSRYARAEKLVEKTLAYPFVKNNNISRGKLYRELATIYKFNGLYAQSLEYYLKAHQLFEKSKSWHNLLSSKIDLAEYYRKLGKYKKANEYVSGAFALHHKKQLADTALLIRLYNRAAAIDNESNPDSRFTIGKSKMALMLAQKSGNKYAEATSLNELGFTYKNLNKPDSAEYFYKSAEEAWISVGATREALNAMNNRAVLYSHNDYPKQKIMEVFSEIIRKVNTENIDYPLADAYSFLYNISLREGDSARALKYFYKYHESAVARVRKENDAQITNITEKYENEKAKKEVKRVSGELTQSKEQLELKEAENVRVYVFLIILVVMLGVIAFLLVRINRANKKLKERNREKDTLIQEIHHRVKNNLQFISSLVNMQMNSSSSDVEIHTLNDASRRIKAMALVHEMLYNQKESTGISIKQYLEELISSLNEVVNSNSIPIQFKMQLDEVNFNVTNSIALGMITSELVSNSMKHAFENTPQPEIEIRLQAGDDKTVLFSVRDNGAGLKGGNESKKTLGIRLIDIFSRQLKGKYKIENNSGCIYEIKFAAK